MHYSPAQIINENNKQQNDHVDERCAWCWPNLHPGRTYPEEWSSTICQLHLAIILRQHLERKKAKQEIA